MIDRIDQYTEVGAEAIWDDNWAQYQARFGERPPGMAYADIPDEFKRDLRSWARAVIVSVRAAAKAQAA